VSTISIRYNTKIKLYQHRDIYLLHASDLASFSLSDTDIVHTTNLLTATYLLLIANFQVNPS